MITFHSHHSYRVCISNKATRALNRIRIRQTTDDQTRLIHRNDRTHSYSTHTHEQNTQIRTHNLQRCFVIPNGMLRIDEQHLMHAGEHTANNKTNKASRATADIYHKSAAKGQTVYKERGGGSVGTCGVGRYFRSNGNGRRAKEKWE